MRALGTLRSYFAAAALALSICAPAMAEDGTAPSYALKINLQENGADFAEASIVVTPGQTYLVDLPASARYKLRVTVSPDTKASVLETFERTLSPQEAQSFIFVSTSLSRKAAGGKMEEVVAPNMLISLYDRAITSVVPMGGHNLDALHSKAKLETLAVTVSGKSWE